MKEKMIFKVVKYFIAFVWLANGLVCKILNFVPRHEEIVARILGEEYSNVLIILIGVSEVIMAIWFLSGIKSKVNAYTQIAIVFIMNILELFLVPDLLLWGRFNSLFALCFILIVYYYQFHLRKSR